MFSTNLLPALPSFENSKLIARSTQASVHLVRSIGCAITSIENAKRIVWKQLSWHLHAKSFKHATIGLGSVQYVQTIAKQQITYGGVDEKMLIVILEKLVDGTIGYVGKQTRHGIHILR